MEHSGTVGEWWMWLSFLGLVLGMIAIDMGLMGKSGAHRVSKREALTWTLIWITTALLFNFALWIYLQNKINLDVANQKSLEFFTGYLIEKFLSVENLFVFLMIFTYFKIPPEYQRRVLLYGVLGALILRFVMIMGGILLIQTFHGLIYFFGAFLIFTGIKMLFMMDESPDLSQNWLLKYLRRHIRITENLHGQDFVVKQKGVYYATPLFIVLIFIEFSDVVFAVDSIPAIFAITDDPFIVMTSNIFAVLGLRALYFLLADVADRFHLLKYGLAIILMFIGGKMVISPWYKIPIAFMLSMVAMVLLVSILLSLKVPKKP